LERTQPAKGLKPPLSGNEVKTFYRCILIKICGLLGLAFRTIADPVERVPSQETKVFRSRLGFSSPCLRTNERQSLHKLSSR
jgi:hypothetical protein